MMAVRSLYVRWSWHSWMVTVPCAEFPWTRYVLSCPNDVPGLVTTQLYLLSLAVRATDASGARSILSFSLNNCLREKVMNPESSSWISLTYPSVRFGSSGCVSFGGGGL